MNSQTKRCSINCHSQQVIAMVKKIQSTCKQHILTWKNICSYIQGRPTTCTVTKLISTCTNNITLKEGFHNGNPRKPTSHASVLVLTISWIRWPTGAGNIVRIEDSKLCGVLFHQLAELGIFVDIRFVANCEKNYQKISV